ncbi:MAG: TetR family transcriptional regulator C-terminal domain-containing protein [Leeuwenhoekiella sp.]
MAAKVTKQVKKTKSPKVSITRDSIMSMYMTYVLEHGARPKSIYKFAKDNNIEESDFYGFFGSFEGLREQVWVSFYDNTLNVLEKDKGYMSYPNKEKMLSFYFTFFEVLTANRSYVLFTLCESENEMKNMKQLSALRKRVKQFAGDLIEQGNEQKNFRLIKNPVGLFSEGAWVQLLFLIKYWMKDNSAGFEKTDIAIEKSVKAVFDVFETTPLESVLDLGKFLFKERFSKA